ncbi:MAG TPA: methyltransferase domain-containing protein [Phycisphaerae bacterium]|nr:methyltransferase domain-containing protein [Phycisphaerae bacterium]
MNPPESSKSAARDTIKYYGEYDEAERLTKDIGPLELIRTRELIARYLPLAPAVIVDVGGASGVYSFWLAGLGYTVHLVDLVPRHIEQAVRQSQSPGSPRLASMKVGDARELPLSDAVADAVIMHGPLYHLPDRTDRLRAIAEARRVLRPGGVLLAFAITRYAGLIFGLVRGYVFDPAYQRMIRTEATTGHRRDPPDWLHTFPEAFFHHPDELRAELREAGLIHEDTLGILGPAWQVPDLDASWADETRRNVILEIARMTEHEPVLGPRLMAVARRP